MARLWWEEFEVKEGRPCRALKRASSRLADKRCSCELKLQTVANTKKHTSPETHPQVDGEEAREVEKHTDKNNAQTYLKEVALTAAVAERHICTHQRLLHFFAFLFEVVVGFQPDKNWRKFLSVL